MTYLLIRYENMCLLAFGTQVFSHSNYLNVLVCVVSVFKHMPFIVLALYYSYILIYYSSDLGPPCAGGQLYCHEIEPLIQVDNMIGKKISKMPQIFVQSFKLDQILTIADNDEMLLSDVLADSFYDFFHRC